MWTFDAYGASINLWEAKRIALVTLESGFHALMVDFTGGSGTLNNNVRNFHAVIGYFAPENRDRAESTTKELHALLVKGAQTWIKTEGLLNHEEMEYYRQKKAGV